MIALALRMSLFYFFLFWTKKAFEVSPNMLKCLIYLWWFAQFTHSHIVSSNFHFTFPSKTLHILAYRQCNELGQFTRLGIHFIDVEITFSLFNIVTTYKSAGAKTTKSNPVRLNIDLWYILNVKASLFCKEFFHISFGFLYFSRHKQEKFHLPAPATFFIMFSPSPSLPVTDHSISSELMVATISGFHRVSAYLCNISRHTAPAYTISCTRSGLWVWHQASTGICAFQNRFEAGSMRYGSDNTPLVKQDFRMTCFSENYFSWFYTSMPIKYCPSTQTTAQGWQVNYSLRCCRVTSSIASKRTARRYKDSFWMTSQQPMIFVREKAKQKFLSRMKKKVNYGKWNSIRANNEFV